MAERTATLVRTEEALRAEETERRRAEERFRLAFETNPDAVTISRLEDGVFLAANAGFLRLHGLRLEEVLGRSAQQLGLWSGGSRLEYQARQLLSFARRRTVAAKPVAVDVLVRGMEKLLLRLLGGEVALNLRLPAGLPEVEADPGQLEQVLLNLVVNARDAVGPGGQVTVETGCVELPGGDGQPGALHLRIAVEDDGAGMDEETRQRVFEPFFTTKTEGKGTGLGLATVHGIIQQHGGFISPLRARLRDDLRGLPAGPCSRTPRRTRAGARQPRLKRARRVGVARRRSRAPRQADARRFAAASLRESTG